MMELEKTLNKKRIIIGMFISVPILSSLISAIHLVTFFNLGNETWMSYMLALVFELGSISAFLILSILPKVNKIMIWSVFSILAGLQIIGNVFYSYSFISDQFIAHPTWLKSFTTFMNYFALSSDEAHILFSIIIGMPIPLIALFFLKSTTQYLQDYKTLSNDIEVVEVHKENDNIYIEEYEEPIIEVQQKLEIAEVQQKHLIEPKILIEPKKKNKVLEKFNDNDFSKDNDFSRD